MRLKYPGVLIIVFLVIVSCGDHSANSKVQSSSISDVTDVNLHQKALANDTVIYLRNGLSKVKIICKNRNETSDIDRGTILLLPGWNYPVEEWCTETSFCERAIAEGYSLILPEMEKSVYASKIYPETREDLQKYATRTWMIDTMIPFFQNEYGLLREGDNNFVAGISTGGRGAALLCLDQPSIFKKGASLSGDFNQTEMPDDNLMKLFYGSFTSFKERWTGNDNVYLNIEKFDVPFYLGHGMLDQVVPASQSVNFYRGLKRVKPNLDVRIHVDSSAAHDYDYWGSEVDRILDFFEEPNQ